VPPPGQTEQLPRIGRRWARYTYLRAGDARGETAMCDHVHLGCLLITVALAAILGCAQRESQAMTGGPGATNVRHEQDGRPKLTMWLAWDGDPKDLNVVLSLKNVGTVPVRIDRELVFFVEVEVCTPEEKLVKLETVRELPRPTDEEIEERIVELQPGDVLHRKVGLRSGFKRFVVDWWGTWLARDVVAGSGPSGSCVSREVISRVSDGASVGRVYARYARPGWDAPRGTMRGPQVPGGRLEYEPAPPLTMNYGLPLDLYGGRVGAKEYLRPPATEMGAAGPAEPGSR